MKMRESRVLKKLRAGEVVSCFNVHFDAQVSDIAGRYGFDCLWIDREHLAQDWVNLQAHIWAAKSHDMDVMVRVPRGSYSDYIKPLEMDAAGIMVPHIMSLEDAEKVVRMTRFHPLGRRPLDGGNADGNYATMNYTDYVRQANEQRFVVVQIEDFESLEELDAIAALEGIDMLFFGPADFSQSIGAPGDWNHPKVIEARKRVAEAAAKYGKYAGIPASIDNMDEMISLGYNFLAVGADVVGVSRYCNQIIEDFKQKVSG
jgi:4-hydroxy-2-oxoheptanedioate aldolase